MERNQPSLYNPISLIGIVMAVLALVITVLLFVLGATGVVANPYTGILAFMVGPAVFVLGLLLIPLGILRERRSLGQQRTFPVIDLNQGHQRRRVLYFGVATVAIALFMAVTTWSATEFMESDVFCGQVCHDVMEPEAAAHQASPHARVHCVSCHIGPGAEWFVRSKISGINQVFAVTLNTYPRPIPAPIEDLRPARDTCEQCHWPERFYGNTLALFADYAEDEQNTPSFQSLVFRVGGSDLGQGIHWHTTARVHYVPLNEERTEIGWVRVENPDGTSQDYVLPGREGELSEERVRAQERFMDCIDCHNRAAHHFPEFAEEMDEAMYTGLINPQIPSIKQQAVQAVGEATPEVTQEQYAATLQRIDQIEDYYRTQLPDVYQRMQTDIEQAVAQIRSIYTRLYFPHMNVTPATYPDLATHMGCFRCHGALVGVGGPADGQVIGAECVNCHYEAPTELGTAGDTPGMSEPPAPVATPPAQGATPAAEEPTPAATAAPAGPAAVPHPVQGREQCGVCHTAGGPGAGAPGGLGMPQDHAGRPDSTCLSCHREG